MAYDFTGTNESGKQSYEGKIVKANAILDNAIEEMRNLGLADFLLSELLRERINPTAAWTAQDDPNFGA